MEHFMHGFMSKFGGLIDWYKRTSASPGFKFKRAVGKTLLVGAPVAYGLHKVTEPPTVQSPSQGVGHNQQPFTAPAGQY